MTVCDSCGEIDMSSIGPLCRQCEDDIQQFDDDKHECDYCGSRYHSTMSCEFDEQEA